MKKAIVIGGGLAGLYSCAILLKHYDQVQLIEKDQRLGSLSPRTGAPQGSHLHVLLKQGQNLLFDRFPALEKDFERRDCQRVDWAEDTFWQGGFGQFGQFDSKVKTLSFSRPLLEGSLFEILQRDPKFEWITGVVTKVQPKSVDVKGGGVFAADLVVVANGDSSLSRPFVVREKKQDLILSYRSVTFSQQGLKLPAKQVYFQADPKHSPVGAVICPIEEGKCIATVIEYGKKISRDEANLERYLSAAKRVADGQFYSMIKDAKPVSQVSLFQKKNTYIREFRKDVEGLVFLGDAVCSLNPSFGQGMTLSLAHGEFLEEFVRDKDLKKFYRKCRKFNARAYYLSSVGSMERGWQKTVLDGVLKWCVSVRLFHRSFLRFHHFLPLRIS